MSVDERLAQMSKKAAITVPVRVSKLAILNYLISLPEQEREQLCQEARDFFAHVGQSPEKQEGRR